MVCRWMWKLMLHPIGWKRIKNNLLRTKMKKSLKFTLKLIRAAVEVVVIGLALIGGFGLYVFTSPKEYDILQATAIDYVQKSENSQTPEEQLKYLHEAVDTYVHCTDMEQAAAMRAALELLPRMKKIQQDSPHVPLHDASYLRILYKMEQSEVRLFLTEFIPSGLFDFTGSDDDQVKKQATYLLRGMLQEINIRRKGNIVDMLKPLVLHLLQQGARTTWPGIKEYNEAADDPVLTAVYTRDADFLRNVLATGCPAEGTHKDSRPIDEARWQNSPELVEILQNHQKTQVH